MKLSPGRLMILVLAAAWVAAAPPPVGAQTPAPSAGAPSETDAAQRLAGKPAPAFSLPDQNDRMRSLAEHKGKWIVLAFFPKDKTKG